MKMKTVSKRQYQTSVRGYKIMCLPFYRLYTSFCGIHCMKNQEVDFLQNKLNLVISIV